MIASIVGAALLALCAYIYFTVKEKYKYFEKLGIAFQKPTFLVGNSWRVFSGQESINVYFSRLYTEFPDEKLFGIFHGTMPMIILRDPDLIGTVLIKEYSNFSERGIPYNEESNPLEGHLFNLGGQKWKTLRNKLSPTFTSGKIKEMLSLMDKCVDVFIEDLDRNLGKEIDVKNEFIKLSAHVIGSCTFGIETDSIRNENSDFTRLGIKIIQPDLKGFILSFLRIIFPNLDKKIKFRVVPKEVNDFFFSLVKDTMDYRKKTGYRRNDFLQLLLELREKGEIQMESKSGKTDEVSDELANDKSDKLVLTDSVLTAQAAVFLAAGFETTSTALGFICYMLSKHNDVQEKLRKEIRTSKEKYNGFTYEALKDMHYLDAVINETLRLWPPVAALIRKCMKTTTFTGITIEKGVTVVIPNMGVQKDSKHYPDPLKFKPERFLEGAPDHYTFLPFGGGPRNCIGERFAITEIKVAVAKLLDKYRVDTCAKMASIEPVKFKVQAFVNIPNDGIFCVINKLQDT